MSAIVLDASKVSSYVLPSLSKSENLMQTSYSTSVSLKNSLPSSFSQRSALNEIVNQIYNIKKEIKDIEGIIDSKLASAKRIESKSESRVGSIASAASKIGSVVGAIGGAALGASTGSIVGTTAGAVVGSSVGSSVGKAIVNTGAKIVDGAVKVGTTIWNGIESIGNWIWDGCKKVANAVTSFVKQAVSGLVKAAKAIWEGLKWVGKQILRVGATIVNVVVSLVEGLVSFIEAIGDVVLLVIGGVCSIFTAISDIITGCITGEWNWTATSAVWKKWILPWVGYDWTSKAFAWQGKWIINDWAYKPFKRGETGAKIVKGVGYVIGIVVASIFTAGGAATAAGSASTVGTSATAMASTFVHGGISSVTSLATTGVATAVTASGTSIAVAGTVEMSVSSGIIAGTAKAAKSMQDGYNKLTDEEKQSGATLRKLGVSSALSGAVEGTTWALTAGTATTAMSKSNSAVISNIGKAFANKSTSTLAKAGLQATKAYATEGISVITDGEYDLDSATIDAVVSAGTSVIYDVGVKKGIDILDKKLASKISAPKVSDNSALDVMDDAAPAEVNSLIKTANKAVHAANTVLKNKDTSKIVGKAIKDPVKEVVEVPTEFLVGKVADFVT